jgi:pimeloyl-ACP methyl ester carboxylesterase
MVVDAAGLDTFPLLGVSQGAAVAVAFAARHPERVTRLILCGAYGRGRLLRASTDEERREAALDLEVARIGWGRDDATFRQMFTSQFLPDGSREQWQEFNELQRLTTSPANAVRFLETFAEIDVTDLAPKVDCATLVMHSRDDLRVPLSAARDLASMIPDAELVSLPSRNHILLDEPAWPIFLAEIDRFLAA